MTIKKLKSIDIINVLSDLVSEKLETTVKLPYFRTTDITGIITLPEGVEMVMPGDNVELDVELIHPIAMEAGTKFSIREGGRTVGAGNVSEIIE